MKNWTSKKELRITVEALREENSELQQRITAMNDGMAVWVRTAIEYSSELQAANPHIKVLQARLSKFDRHRGAGGKYFDDNAPKTE